METRQYGGRTTSHYFSTVNLFGRFTETDSEQLQELGFTWPTIGYSVETVQGTGRPIGSYTLRMT